MATTTMTMPSAANTTASSGENSTKSGMANRPHPSVYMTIDGLIRSHGAEDDDIPMIGYPAQGVSDYEVHTAKTDPSLDKAPVVALLTPSCFDAIISFFALNRLGWAVLFLSTRLTAPAYVSLMNLADCNTIIAPPMYNNVVSDIQTQLQCTSLPRINSEDYRPTFNVPKFFRECDKAKESRKVAWIIHSSGSTGFPKPIFITNFGCLANFQKGLGLRSFTASPLFHSHALMEFGRAIYAKRTMFFSNHAFPVTRHNLLAAMKVAKPEMVCAVPYVLKLLAEKDEGITELVKAKIVMYGGSTCPDALGDELVSKGVRLAGNYGATETGHIMNSFRPEGDNEWSYNRLHRPVADHVLMDEISPGVFECVALDGLPSKDTTNSDDPPNSFRTRDLFTRHPDPKKSNYWKYLSRLDDRLTLINGEKVLPIPIEGHICQHELIQEAAVFGVQRTVPGVIVFRSEHAADLSDEVFLDKIWSQIEEANSQAETFSHIPRDLVVMRPFDEVYPRTDKGTIIRAQLYEQYKDTIQAAYDRFENGATPADSSSLRALDVPELEVFLLDKFRNELHAELESVTSDIFSAGVDSLQTTRVWNMIKKEIDLGGNQAKLSQNVVFERGTVKSLAQHLYNLRVGIDEDEADSNAEAQVQIMHDLINKYSTFTPHDAKDKPTVSSKTVLLTGVTGGLGSVLLANLLKRNDISRIYTLVRATTLEFAAGRVFSSLSSRNLLTTIPPADLGKIVALPSDLSLPTLGLDSYHLSNLLSSVTHIIHSAWAVNFNLPLLSFEAQHIRGVYNMIEHIALRTTHSQPASFYFCSSISAASGTPKPATIAETQIDNLAHAQSMGYGRSKLVSERITHAAMKSTGMTSRVLRIGQLAGDTVNAIWNDTEAIALMIRSVLPESAGCLPALDESPSWLPVDKAAETIEELVFPEQESQQDEVVYHILNPQSFSFKKDLVPMLQAHPDVPEFQVVPVREWLDRLRASDGDVSRNPSKKLMDFWEGKYGAISDKEVVVEDTPKKEEEMENVSKGLTFNTSRTCQDSACLRSVQDPVSDGLMSRIVGVWMGKWKREIAAFDGEK
ncbi:putative NRPS-like protein biosynthetic cluster [Knufia obscura]|uniref:NRPS-like protein biosynthetic cluster n=1 Tax=Knufia obscura TaxID=1635080 RepID=A0ABR0S1W6_9EURO|nr:putative NRPS-like protein biosynthetic cluster [Knufia obscura]